MDADNFGRENNCTLPTENNFETLNMSGKKERKGAERQCVTTSQGFFFIRRHIYIDQAGTGQAQINYLVANGDLETFRKLARGCSSGERKPNLPRTESISNEETVISHCFLK